jgi:hypothetical protein
MVELFRILPKRQLLSWKSPVLGIQRGNLLSGAATVWTWRCPLEAHRQVKGSLVNPRRARRFAESLRERNKTDRMPECCVNMALPSPGCLGNHRFQLPCSYVHLHGPLRTLMGIHTQQNNRAHAAAASQALSGLVVKETQRHQKYPEQRVTRLRREALRLVGRHRELDRRSRPADCDRRR